ncbi:uncharacterized protein LOC108137851 isoform X2 [Drosophila elegans]|uniref:uncharacterized protein LOC108137851 isoform X2 n=1 Tax=Drosophila elegans TaxID=30023 RepID=UPI001BC83778|nr:uncharacterized protein LOC108137851 isoform X2 [Drosophila elegans]
MWPTTIVLYWVNWIVRWVVGATYCRILHRSPPTPWTTNSRLPTALEPCRPPACRQIFSSTSTLTTWDWSEVAVGSPWNGPPIHRKRKRRHNRRWTRKINFSNSSTRHNRCKPSRILISNISRISRISTITLGLEFAASLNLDMTTDGSSGYDDMKFLSVDVDQFTIDSFKADCILSMEQSQMQPYVGHSQLVGSSNELCLEGIGISAFGMEEGDPKTPPSLLVLDKTLPSLSIGVEGIVDLVEQLHHHHQHEGGSVGAGDVL